MIKMFWVTDGIRSVPVWVSWCWQGGSVKTFMVFISSFKSSIQHDVHFVSYGPIYSKTDNKAGCLYLIEFQYHITYIKRISQMKRIAAVTGVYIEECISEQLQHGLPLFFTLPTWSTNPGIDGSAAESSQVDSKAAQRAQRTRAAHSSVYMHTDMPPLLRIW